MLPYSTLLSIDRQSTTPIYLQITNNMILQIKKGVIGAGTKLPGSRALSEQLQVHRKTIIKTYEELLTQGWIEQIPAKGTFVNKKLPEVTPEKISLANNLSHAYPIQTGFTIQSNILLHRPVIKAGNLIGFDDGFPDVRLAPVEALSRTYRTILQRSFQKKLLLYGETQGNPYLREVLADYLHQSRGLAISSNNICITRGSVMGIHLAAKIICKQGDKVIVAEANYPAANMIFQQLGVQLLRVPVDEQGICVDSIETLCKGQSIRLLYITSHHHYPTTVTLSAERRIRLLQLAAQYGFAILEDDYDYDFHYTSSPILPLASADTHGMVVYVGSLTKAIAPAFRVGYIVAPQNLIEEAGYLRRIIDRQGDLILEQAMAELIAEGELKRHLKKAQKLYHERRNFFCDLLEKHFPESISFKVPEGGMAVWATFHQRHNLETLSTEAQKQGLLLGNGKNYDCDLQNMTRMGFASSNLGEIEHSIHLLQKVMT
ncbi:PLP-dependent aminotransferase family protein [Cytophagaceae bacterium DM2B3-1]|uniref:PLP-dependent aminotransferase family protein n=1 Tax=Xanthocytophaga flava TaxID=3048013 RepID=A0ABT7CWC7_9BACT|nr:PLP-dependent aminotransferase family protein [Xanthocytophaga flavus]MDJ1467437.1 PLP-dependent aminotransferase family protein [Xanthocytophaga flavus]MDJ1498025.1 PLP-dependent aminotransferase family protein [Xanthocytophaga flavus]